MADLVYCGECGERISATANFCKHCGAAQGPVADEGPASQPTEVLPEGAEPTEAIPPPAPQAQTPPPPPPPTAGGARDGAERVAPGAGEFADQLARQLRTPGVALAGIGALVGLAICLAAGLVLAIITPNASLLSMGGDGLLKETLGQMVAFSQANLSLKGSGTTVRTVPVLFVLFPIAGVAVGTASASARTVGMSFRDRFLWAAAAGLPFAVLMLIASLSVGHIEDDLLDARVEFSSGSVFLLSLLWGGLGGALGMLFALRREGAGRTPSLLPPTVARYVGAAWAALRPLLLALLAIGVLSTAIWVVQMARESDYRQSPPRSTAVAVGEQLAYFGDHAIDTLPLGAGASQRLVSVYPVVPIAQDQVLDLFEGNVSDAESAPTYNLFDFGDTMSAVLFVPMMIVFIAIPALLALYGGFAIARRLGERRPSWAALWGAAVGPLWSVTMVLLATLARKQIVGDPTGDGVFVAFLVGGAVLGAAGGFLAAQGQAAHAGPPAPPLSA